MPRRTNEGSKHVSIDPRISMGEHTALPSQDRDCLDVPSYSGVRHIERALLDINSIAGQNNINAALKIGVLDIKNVEPEPIEIRRIRVNDEWDVMATAPDFNNGLQEAVPQPVQVPKRLGSGDPCRFSFIHPFWSNYSYNKGD